LTVLLHCRTSILLPVWLGRPYQEYKLQPAQLSGSFMYVKKRDSNKVKSSTITAGNDVGVTNMVKVHRVMMKALRGQSNHWD